jgi:hypothetical protein
LKALWRKRDFWPLKKKTKMKDVFALWVETVKIPVLLQVLKVISSGFFFVVLLGDLNPGPHTYWQVF